mmetsp:Transcript_21124/g.68138  ORF Transcript_21124/g.68138 Transcript_21124/m.68138 type:complete len:406 (-) Transcript_21124:271-1488(-)
MRAPELVVRDELHDVARGDHAAVLQRRIVRVKLFHCAKVRIADSDDDDGQGQRGRAYHLRDRRIHVVDDPVRNDQQHRVHPFAGAQPFADRVGDFADQRRKQGGPTEADALQSITVDIEDAAHAVHLFMFPIKGEREAVVHATPHLPPKAIHGEPLVRVVLLENGTDAGDGRLIRVGHHGIEVVQRAGRGGGPIGRRKVDADHQVDLVPAHDVVQHAKVAHHGALGGDDHPRVAVLLALLAATRLVDQRDLRAHLRGQLPHRGGRAPDEVVPARLVPVPALQPQHAVQVPVAQRLHANLGQRKGGIQRLLDHLAFPYQHIRSILTDAHKAQERIALAEKVLLVQAATNKLDLQHVVAAVDLLSADLQRALVCPAIAVLQRQGHTPTASHDMRQRCVNCSSEIVVL